MVETRGRRQYSREYKIEAVKLITEKGLCLAQVARDLGIHENVLRKWKRRLRDDPEFAQQKKSDQQAEELRRLRRENEILRQEREILKKAAAYFAKESQ